MIKRTGIIKRNVWQRARRIIAGVGLLTALGIGAAETNKTIQLRKQKLEIERRQIEQGVKGTFPGSTVDTDRIVDSRRKMKKIPKKVRIDDITREEIQELIKQGKEKNKAEINRQKRAPHNDLREAG